MAMTILHTKQTTPEPVYIRAQDLRDGDCIRFYDYDCDGLRATPRSGLLDDIVTDGYVVVGRMTPDDGWPSFRWDSGRWAWHKLLDR